LPGIPLSAKLTVKNEKSNISTQELEALSNLVKDLLMLTDAEIEKAIYDKVINEVQDENAKD